MTTACVRTYFAVHTAYDIAQLFRTYFLLSGVFAKHDFRVHTRVPFNSRRLTFEISIYMQNAKFHP